MTANHLFKPPIQIKNELMERNSNPPMTVTRKQLLLTLRQGGGRSINGFQAMSPQMLESSISNNGGGIGPQRRVPVKGEICPSAIVAPERPVANLRKKLGGLDPVAEVASEHSPPPVTCATSKSTVTTTCSTKLSREDFLIRSKEMLFNPAVLLSDCSPPPSLSELTEGLRTAMARIDRLTEYRRQQTSRNTLLQQQMDQMGEELDQSVDALRAQKAKLEAERRRANVEARELRRQLAEAIAVMEQSKIAAADGFRKAVLMAQHTEPDKEVFCSNCDNLSLDALTLRASVERLERDLGRQREASEKEAARLRGQLAESTSDVRSLRLQLARLSRISSGSGEPNIMPKLPPSPTVQTDSPCIRCQRLQKLVDVLQRKQLNQPDVVTGCSSSRLSSTPPIPLSEAEVQTITPSLQLSPWKIEAVVTPLESIEVSIQTEFVHLDPSQLESPKQHVPGYVESPIEAKVIPVMMSHSEDCGNLFGLLESFGNNITSNHLTDLTTEYLEEKLGQCLEPLRNETVQSLMKEEASSRGKLSTPKRHRSSSPKSIDVGRLLERLEVLEDEVQSSAEQLKESNIEFLQLRERLTSATVERAHLKATVDGLDDQVIQLEAALFERSQELNLYKEKVAELSKQKEEKSKMQTSTYIQIPSETSSYEADNEDAPLLSVSIAPAVSSAVSFQSPPRVVQRIQLPHSLLNSPRIKLLREKISIALDRLAPYANKAQITINYVAHLFMEKTSVYHEKLNRPCNLIGERLLLVTNRVLGKKPGLSLVMALMIYLAFLHLLLISCWIQ